MVVARGTQEAVDPVAEGEGETGDDDAPAAEPEAEAKADTDAEAEAEAEAEPDAEPDAEAEAEPEAEPEAETDSGHLPTFRNRSGRRMAGRRKAQPSRVKGKGGSKYLKRCPARNERVQRKRGRGRGQEGYRTTWSGVVRGGAQPGEEEVCLCVGLPSVIILLMLSRHTVHRIFVSDMFPHCSLATFTSAHCLPPNTVIGPRVVARQRHGPFVMAKYSFLSCG